MSYLKENIKVIYIFVATLLALATNFAPIPQTILESGNVTLTSAGQTSLAVLVFALILWMTESIPFHITGVLALVLMAIFRIDSFKEIVKVGFGSDIFIFFLGVLILSSFITRSGLGKRISMFMISKTGNDTKLIVLGFLIIGAFLSMWLTEMAVAAMLTPLAVTILKEQKVEPLKSNFGKALMIATAWGPVIGGVGTPAGSGTNPLAVGFLKDMAGIDVSFLKWMMYGVPSTLLLIIPTWAIIILFFKPEIKTLSKSAEELTSEYNNLPKMDREEIVTIVITLLTIIAWLTTPLLERLLGISIPISMPILITTSLFFFPKISKFTWKEVEKEISWNGIILIVSGISLGMMLFKTGAAKWLAVVLLSGVGGLHPLVQAFAIVMIVSLLKILFTSNTVTGTIIVPIVIAMAQNLGLNPLVITLPAALTSSLAFILVTSSPTIIIPYSAGYFSISDMAKAGVFMTLVASIIVSLTIYTVGVLSHLY